MSVHRFASLAGALLVAAIAALASYTHMRTVALHYGQPPLIAALLPVSVDGLMATATVALGDGRQHRWSAWLAFWTGVAASVLANVLAAEPSLPARCISAWPAVAFVLVVEVIIRGTPSLPAADDHPHAVSGPTVASKSPVPAGRGPDGAPTGPGGSAGPDVPSDPSGPRTRKPASGAGGRPSGRARRPIEQTRELAAKVRAQNPQISQAELARQLGISATRLRQIDRAEVAPELPPPVDRADPALREEAPTPLTTRPLTHHAPSGMTSADGDALRVPLRVRRSTRDLAIPREPGPRPPR